MERVVLKRIEKYFESSKYTLVIYYHKDLSIKDIYNRVIKKEKEYLQGNEPETKDRNEALVCPHEDGIAFLIINSKTPLGVILHETIHIASAIFEFIGASHSEGTDELYAYHAQHIFEYIVATMVEKLCITPRNLLTFN
jgi:hypothetical protein